MGSSAADTASAFAGSAIASPTRRVSATRDLSATFARLVVDGVYIYLARIWIVCVNVVEKTFANGSFSLDNAHLRFSRTSLQ